jgi:hypothetical protein
MKRLPKNHAKKRGPIEVIQGKNTRIPIYDAGAGKFIVAYYAEGKRKLVKFQSLEAAKRGAKDVIERLTTGIAHVATFTPKQTAAINDAADVLKPTGVTLTEAVRQFAEAHMRGWGFLRAKRPSRKIVGKRDAPRSRGDCIPASLPYQGNIFN